MKMHYSNNTVLRYSSFISDSCFVAALFILIAERLAQHDKCCSASKVS